MRFFGLILTFVCMFALASTAFADQSNNHDQGNDPHNKVGRSRPSLLALSRSDLPSLPLPSQSIALTRPRTSNTKPRRTTRQSTKRNGTPPLNTSRRLTLLLLGTRRPSLTRTLPLLLTARLTRPTWPTGRRLLLLRRPEGLGRASDLFDRTTPGGVQILVD